MPFCPKCKYEYCEGIEECPDCNIKLVKKLHEEIKPEHIDSELVQVGSFLTITDAEMARVRLEGEGVESVVMDSISPNLYVGFSLVNGGVRLMVRLEDIDRAKKILLDD